MTPPGRRDGSPGDFLGIMPGGDALKGSKGGTSNGPTILPAVSSLDNFSVTLVGLSLALLRFWDRIAIKEPKYRMEKP